MQILKIKKSIIYISKSCSCINEDTVTSLVNIKCQLPATLLLLPPRLPMLAHLAQPESGRAAETQLRRVAGLEKEIHTFSEQLKRLGEKCDRMVRADHFDLTGLQARHSQLQELFAQLSGQSRQRKAQIGG
jgi:hypothetical protein